MWHVNLLWYFVLRVIPSYFVFLSIKLSAMFKSMTWPSIWLHLQAKHCAPMTQGKKNVQLFNCHPNWLCPNAWMGTLCSYLFYIFRHICIIKHILTLIFDICIVFSCIVVSKAFLKKCLCLFVAVTFLLLFCNLRFYENMQNCTF